jgi:hypothetical protein
LPVACGLGVAAYFKAVIVAAFFAGGLATVGYICALVFTGLRCLDRSRQVYADFIGEENLEGVDPWEVSKAILEAHFVHFVRNKNPEKLGHILAFFLPKKIRERCFTPFFEELKEDRVKANAAQTSLGPKVLIEIGFLWRLGWSFFCSLVCMLRELIPLSEILRFFQRSS